MKIPYKKTKILATIGPASRSPRVIEKLLKRGANCFRINFSHGTHEEHEAVIKTIRSIARKLGLYPAILADLQGPKIRTGMTPGNATVILSKGSTVTLIAGNNLCTEREIYINYRSLLADISEGQRILINDGAVCLQVCAVDKQKGFINCKVLNTGVYSSHKGVNFPDANLRVPSLTKKDRKDLKFILAQDFNFIALSFVRRAEDAAGLVRLVNRKRKDIKVISKIEKSEAINHIPAILDACDGIMIARGDLGVETSVYHIAVMQKNFITEANRRAKIVIVATQMLESMIEHPLPTRAEATDVANAILDGTDAVMLSGETAIGNYPDETVDTMANIARVTEESPYYPRRLVDLSTRENYPPHAICEAAGWASRDLGDVPVVVFTTSGDTALYLAKTRNQSRIFAFSPYKHVACMLSLACNVTPFVLPFEKELAVLQKKSEVILQKANLVKKGQLLLMVSGTTIVEGATNFLRVKKVGEV